MPEFNLIDERWLRVRRGDCCTEWSLRQVLLDAHRVDGLVLDLPTQLPALLRQLLLPLAVGALGRPADRRTWREWFEAGRFSEKQLDQLNEHLDKHRHRFDLFDAKVPFGQVADLRTGKDETKGSALLVATAATGNNVPLFAVRSEADPLPLTPAEAAHWLLHTQCWDTAAIKTGVVGDTSAKAGKTTGNPTGPLGQLGVVLPIGRTLFETLLLNIPLNAGRVSDDLPHWEKEPLGPNWASRPAKGLIDLWTWQARRIRLFPEETPEGPRVTRVIIAAGDRLTETPEFEPHTAWTLPATGKNPARESTGGKGKKSGDGPVLRRPRRHQPGKAAWRGLDAFLAFDRTDTDAAPKKDGFATSVLLDQIGGLGLDDDFPLQIDLTGIVYGTQSAVVDDVLHDSIPVPLLSLRAESDVYFAVLAVVDQAERLARAVNNLSADLRRASGAEPVPWDKGQRPGELVLHGLDPLVRRLLVGLRQAGQDDELAERGRLAWEKAAWGHTWRIANQLVDAAAPNTFTGRTVVVNGREHTYRLGTAEHNFRLELWSILDRAKAAFGTRDD